MNIKIVLNLLGRTILCEAMLLILPAIVALLYGESVLGFAAAAAVAVVIGLLCITIKPSSKNIYTREGFTVCALSWIVLSLIGAIPFVVEKWIPSYVDAVFEIVSGFTTTGATVLGDFSHTGTHGLFFWRSFSHFIGGMGVLVFILAVMPLSEGRSIHLMRAEVPGPVVGKLVPKIKNTAIILYLIYIALTIIEVIFLICGGMSLYEAVIHAFATAGTGGFSNRAGSIGEFSPYIQYVIGVFMIIFATNFNLHYLILIGHVKDAVKNEELHWLYGIVVVFTALITANIFNMFSTGEAAVRTAFFQVSSIISSTGFTTIDFSKLPMFSQMLIIVLMFIGASAGSTGGALKVSRVIVLIKSFTCELRRLIHPAEVVKVRLDKRPVSDKVVVSILQFFGMYMFIVAASILVVSLDGFDFSTTASSVISCIGNMGPGLWLGSSFEMFSPLSKVVLSFNMLIGRLEILPIIILFTPSVWKYGTKKLSV